MTESTLIEFPCMFPIKIIGTNSPSFIDDVRQITLKHFPNFSENDLSQKPSKKNNYLALTVTVYALNQAMLDDFYRDITQHNDVKMVL